MPSQTQTTLVDSDLTNVPLLGLLQLSNAYQDALFAEAQAQIEYNDAQALTEYRRDEVVFDAYEDGHIEEPNERRRKLRETMIIADDEAVGWLEWYERKALNELILKTGERKRIEAEISITKAWLYSQSGMATP
jgi:hypothetical protein